MLNTNSSTGSILVPIANPETVSQLVSTAIDLAEDQKLDLELLTVVPVPEQLPLSAGRQFSDEKQDMLNDAVESITHPDLENFAASLWPPAETVGITVRSYFYLDLRW